MCKTRRPRTILNTNIYYSVFTYKKRHFLVQKAVLFGAWREALFTRRERREAPHPRRTNVNDFVMRGRSSEGMAGDMLVSAADWTGYQNPCDWLAQKSISFEETNLAIDRGKRGKGTGPDETTNEHLQNLDGKGRGEHKEGELKRAQG